MPYADLAAVKGRAGRLADTWDDTTDPGNADIELFLQQGATEIDAVLDGHGITTPVTGAAAGALEGLNADYALDLALAGSYPSGQARAAVSDLLEDVRARLQRGFDALKDGTHAAIVIPASEGAGPAASDFWSDEPNYDQVTRYDFARGLNPSLQPQIGKTSRF